MSSTLFLLTPLREGRQRVDALTVAGMLDFYSRPCGRGDVPAECDVFLPGNQFLLTPLREGRRSRPGSQGRLSDFYSRPCGRGDAEGLGQGFDREIFLLTPLREGRQDCRTFRERVHGISTHAPAGGATGRIQAVRAAAHYFYSRPCGRGDVVTAAAALGLHLISTHAPAGGATAALREKKRWISVFLLTPLREGRPKPFAIAMLVPLFLLTPLREGRPSAAAEKANLALFLLTPLREGRRGRCCVRIPRGKISTHAPAGGATHSQCVGSADQKPYFYSRPCGRGDASILLSNGVDALFLLTPLREGRPPRCYRVSAMGAISTHAPAGGATAIFHKSVMRFCGKLPKDDTVLCLASFGFPRRDPKAVYLAWISCANLPQKCVRQGLALKDQGTSCFHEGLASHAFDPVLV